MLVNKHYTCGRDFKSADLAASVPFAPFCPVSNSVGRQCITNIATKKSYGNEDRNESAALHQAQRTGQGRTVAPHGQDSRQGKEQFYRTVLMQVQGGCKAVERHGSTVYGQEQDGGHGKPGD